MNKKLVALILSSVMIFGTGAINVNAETTEDNLPNQVKVLEKKLEDEISDLEKKLDELHSMLKEKSTWNKKFKLIKDFDFYFQGGKREFKLSNANEDFAEAINYNGEIYLPAKAFADVLGEDFNYDKSNNAVYIGEKNEAKYIWDVLESFDSAGSFILGSDTSSKILGKRYSATLSFGTSSSEQFLKYNLDSSYNKINGMIGVSDNCKETGEFEIEFIGDGNTIKTIKAKKGDAPKKFSVNVEGIKILTIKSKENQDFYHLGNSGVELVEITIE